MRHCKQCDQTKELSDFPVSKVKKEGRAYICKKCNAKRAREWHHKNKKRAYARMQEYREKNPEIFFAINSRWNSNNRKKCCEMAKRYRQENPAKCMAMAKAKVLRKRKAMPAWANKVKIEKLYALSDYMTRNKGIQHHVDHVIPLKNKLVCGLHVEGNLRVINAEDNLKKRNKFSIL